ncbi:hypothetical protein [Streptomyces sp. NPDC055794]
MTSVVPEASTATPHTQDQRPTAAARLDLNRVIEAMPEAVTLAMQTVLPDKYTPELATQIAQDAIASLRRRALLTEAETTLTYEEGFGSYRTAPVETAMRNVDSVFSDAENAQTPLFAAQVVVMDWQNRRPVKVDGKFVPGGQVDGRFTEMRVSHGTSTGEMSPSEAREIVPVLRGFADRLEALCDRADEIAADDFELDAEESERKREALDRRVKAIDEASA